MSVANTLPSESQSVYDSAYQSEQTPDKSAASASRSAPVGDTSRGILYYAVVLWGVVGVGALLGRALWRMTPIALEPITAGTLTAVQIGLYGLWVVFNGYGEGYRAFQKAFCPRVVARAHHLAQTPTWITALLAPLYCLSLFHANRKGLTVAWVMVAVIFGLVQLLGITPQPWRGIVDGGVVVALSWGALALLVFAVRLLVTGVPPQAKMNLPQ